MFAVSKMVWLLGSQEISGEGVRGTPYMPPAYFTRVDTPQPYDFEEPRSDSQQNRKKECRSRSLVFLTGELLLKAAAKKGGSSLSLRAIANTDPDWQMKTLWHQWQSQTVPNFQDLFLVLQSLACTSHDRCRRSLAPVSPRSPVTGLGYALHCSRVVYLSDHKHHWPATVMFWEVHVMKFQHEAVPTQPPEGAQVPRSKPF